ncbi:hypothetical protein GGR53DRAFT_471944 [Hypoxylon sp. FL1150]|nr:hypothetical protein GGR53DRAFT_471944 [Hypoxylon sp. FL1150]
MGCHSSKSSVIRHTPSKTALPPARPASEQSPHRRTRGRHEYWMRAEYPLHTSTPPWHDNEENKARRKGLRTYVLDQRTVQNPTSGPPWIKLQEPIIPPPIPVSRLKETQEAAMGLCFSVPYETESDDEDARERRRRRRRRERERAQSARDQELPQWPTSRTNTGYDANTYTSDNEGWDQYMYPHGYGIPGRYPARILVHDWPRPAERAAMGLRY